jgi:hypothetical protein
MKVTLIATRGKRRTILQNTCFVAVGKVFRGFWVSAAARPTSSVPPKANAAVLNTVQKPLNPSIAEI